MGYFKKPVLKIEEMGKKYYFYPRSYLLWGNGDKPAVVIGRSNYFGKKQAVPHDINLIGIEERGSDFSSVFVGFLNDAPSMYSLEGERIKLNGENVGPVPMNIKNNSELEIKGEMYRINTSPRCKDLIGAGIGGIEHEIRDIFSFLERYITEIIDKKKVLTQP